MQLSTLCYYIEEEVGRQHQGMDKPGVRQVPEGSGEQGKMEKTGCKIICGTPTTLAVKGLMMMRCLECFRYCRMSSCSAAWSVLDTPVSSSKPVCFHSHLECFSNKGRNFVTLCFQSVLDTWVSSFSAWSILYVRERRHPQLWVF